MQAASPALGPYAQPAHRRRSCCSRAIAACSKHTEICLSDPAAAVTRRALLALAPPLALAALTVPDAGAVTAAVNREKYEYMPALEQSDFGKPRITYPDFTLTATGLQYKDLKEGSGAQASKGSRVTVDWDGYTIGYYGRPFQARNKAKGGAFNRDDGGADSLRFTVGDANVLGAFNEAVQGMRVGGIRRIIVGPGPLFYPASGRDARKVLPQPSTFSGERALYFVLENQGLIDKTLLFDLELLRIDK